MNRMISAGGALIPRLYRGITGLARPLLRDTLGFSPEIPVEPVASRSAPPCRRFL